MQCPSCGSYDQLDLGFCTSCGVYFKKEVSGSGMRDETGLVGPNREMTYEEFLRNTIYGLSFTLLMAIFMLAYLSWNNTDPLLILFIEMFPAMWFVLILLQWRENKKKIKNAK